MSTKIERYYEHTPGPPEQQKANTALIAAAPDLLAALKSVVPLLEERCDDTLDATAQFREVVTAIARAEGKEGCMSKLYRCPTCGNEYCDKDSPHMVKTLKANTSKAYQPEITLHKKRVKLSQIVIPDCWHLAMRLQSDGDTLASEYVLETWHIAHALKEELQGGAS